MDTIRGDDNLKSPAVLNLIRSNAPLEEIRQFLGSDPQPASGPSDDSETPAKIQRPASKKYLDVKSLTDVPLYEVPAQPWTSVTNDDSFVSHLVSLYFTWQHPVLNWIDVIFF